MTPEALLRAIKIHVRDYRRREEDLRSNYDAYALEGIHKSDILGKVILSLPSIYEELKTCSHEFVRLNEGNTCGRCGDIILEE